MQCAPSCGRSWQIGTKGGIVFYTFVGIGLPFYAYNFMLENLGWDVVLAGNVILVGYVGLATVLWTGRCVRRPAPIALQATSAISNAHLARLSLLALSIHTVRLVSCRSYVFRVANKDMTYAQQLRDYENAVIQKRFEELSEEEVDALMGEIYPGAPGKPPSKPE